MRYKIVGLMLFFWCVAATNAHAIIGLAAIGVWRQSLDGTIGYLETGDPQTIDLGNELNVDDETNINARVKVDLPAFFPNFYLAVAPAEFEGSGSKSIAFEYGDVTFDRDATLNTKVTANQYDIALYWGVPLLKTATINTLNIDFGLNVRILDLEATLTGESGGIVAEEKESITVPVPMLYLAAQFMPIDNLRIEAEVRAISISGNTLTSLIGRVAYEFAGPVFAAAGYRYDKIDVDEEGVKAEIDFTGPFLEVGLSF